jgi:glycosyltransferase involved in cell wall biosynthesis
VKILYSCLSKSWGGMEMYSITVIRKLLDRNISVELVCLSDSRLHIEANNLGIIIHPLKAGGYFHPFAMIRIALLIRRSNYDIIHCNASKDLWLLVPAIYLSFRKILLYLTKQMGSFINKKDFLHKILYKRINRVFAISTVIKYNLLDTCPVTEEQITLLHNGVDTKVFDPAKADRQKIRNEFNISDNELVIGMLARFTKGKGHEEFLWAARELNKTHKDLKFMIVGEASRGEDAYAQGIKILAKNYELSNVIFTGFRSDTPDVLSSMDIFVFPSHSEAFGIALVEAMAMEKPSVCSNENGILDIAIDNETSLLFENKNAEDLFRKICLLIDSKEKRDMLGKSARKRAVEFFDMDYLTDKVVKFYRQDLEKQSKLANSS